MISDSSLQCFANRGVCVCMRACMRASMRACMRACVCVDLGWMGVLLMSLYIISVCIFKLQSDLSDTKRYYKFLLLLLLLLLLLPVLEWMRFATRLT